MRIICLVIVAFTLSCKPVSPEIEAVTGTAWSGGDEYTIEQLAGDIQEVTKVNDDGIVVERGILKGGMKNGNWTTYFRNGEPHIMASYVNGVKNGAYIEFDTKGRFQRVMSYANDQLHGTLKEFEFYTQKNEESHRHGKLHGIKKEFIENGVLFRTISYKDGVIDGPMTYYNPEGEATLEYIYQDGERVNK